MRKWPIQVWNHEKTYKQLATDNGKAIEEFNGKMLSALTLMGGLLMALPLLAVPFSNTKLGAVPSYLLAASVFFALYLIFKLPFAKKYTIVGLYI